MHGRARRIFSSGEKCAGAYPEGEQVGYGPYRRLSGFFTEKSWLCWDVED